MRGRLVPVNEVGGEVAFALDVDDSSQRDAVPDALHHLGRLLRHLRAEEEEEEEEGDPMRPGAKEPAWRCSTSARPALHPRL